MSMLTAKDIGGLDEALRELLEKLPGRLPDKQVFFNTRFHLKVPKTSYNLMWDALRSAGDLARAKYIFDYARLHLPKRTRTLLDQAVRGKAVRAAADPPITDLLLYQNGKPRRLGRLLSEYLPSDEGKTVLMSPRPAPAKASTSTAPTVIAPPRRPRTPPPVLSSATTATSDGEAGGWWRNQKRYEPIRRIDKGGMGVVYLVNDSRNGRERAAKVIAPNHRKDDEYQARFRREVRAQSLLRHANILRILDHGLDYYICEVCDGSLRQLIERGTVGMAMAVSLFSQACRGVAFAHAGRVLHRDIKPANLLLRKTGGLVVADFGLCKIDSSEFTTVTGSNVHGGTVRYSAPEQLRSMRDADHRADVYSLGVLLQDLLVGTSNVGIGDDQALTRVGANPLIPAIVKATAYRREHRFDSVDELRLAVEKAVAGRR